MFLCTECKHTFTTTLHNVSLGKWCPFCMVPPKKMCLDQECLVCLKKSCMSLPKPYCWSAKNVKQARQCFVHTYIKRIFTCNRCSKEFKLYPYNVSIGEWCPYCKLRSQHIIETWIQEMYPTARIKKNTNEDGVVI